MAAALALGLAPVLESLGSVARRLFHLAGLHRALHAFVVMLRAGTAAFAFDLVFFAMTSLL
jgi:hypothetical protein